MLANGSLLCGFSQMQLFMQDAKLHVIGPGQLERFADTAAHLRDPRPEGLDRVQARVVS